MAPRRLIRFGFLWGTVVLLSLPLPGRGFALAVDLRLSSETLLRVFERDTVEKEDADVIPGYEYLQLDFGSLRTKGLSLHLYGWGRADFGDGSFYEEETAGELLYGYLEYVRPFSNLELRLGRQYIFEGVADESVDGLRVSTDLGRYFGLSLYGGFPVSLDATDGRGGDSIWGGRISHRLGTRYQIGFSYKVIDNDDDQAEEMAAVDLSLALPWGVSLHGFSSHNLDTEGWAEHSWELRFHLADLHFRPFFQRFQYEDYFTTGANSARPFRILAATGETLTVFGGDLFWHLSDVWDLGLKAKFHDLEERGESSESYSALLTWHGADLTQIGGEVGFLAGDAAQNDYWLARAFFFQDKVPGLLPRGFLTGDVVWTLYDEEISGEEFSFFASVGAGSRFLDEALVVKLSGDYSSDPNVDEDLRGMLVVSYLFER